MAKLQTFELTRGRVFICGLFWQPLPGATTRARKAEIEKIAAEQKFDLAVVRSSGAPQVGFGSTSTGMRPGMLSAAAMVSKTFEVEGGDRNFLCAIVVPENNGRWLYVAQREGVLLHDGDLLGSEDEVRSRLLTDMSLSDWQTIIAPDHWGVSGAEERNFLDFFPKKGSRLDYKKWWGLKPVKANWRDLIKAYWPVLLLVAIGLASTVGYSQWQKYRAAQEQARIARAIAEQAAAANVPIKPEHPWKKSPRASAFVDTCVAAFGSVRTFWPGNWTLRDVTCGNGVLKVVWIRQDHGWIEHLQAMEPRATFSADGATAMLTLPLSLSTGEDESAPVESDRMLELNNGAQRFGIKATLSVPPGPAALPGDKPGAQPVVNDWKTLAWAVKGSALPPAVIVKAMDGNGFRLNTIQAVFSGGVMNWNLEGVQYVQP